MINRFVLTWLCREGMFDSRRLVSDGRICRLCNDPLDNQGIGLHSPDERLHCCLHPRCLEGALEEISIFYPQDAERGWKQLQILKEGEKQ